ncbi:MAG: alanine--tRNA ligase [Candidatus Woesearchaeota archaeon]
MVKTAKELKNAYLDFFKKQGHAIISSAPLIPVNDPTVLFTTAGMHPLVPFLMGQPHPAGKRLADVQRCIRTQDIDEVGDDVHTTFFEMLGNWSLADYFKQEAIEWSWEFLTGKHWLNLDPERLAVTCFKGDDDAPRDDEAASAWRALGVPAERIAFLAKKENWWGPAGETGPCGPDTEMFYWKLNDEAPKVFDPKDTNWVEIWNDVFMQYNKTENGYKPLAQKNIDTGLGVERVTMVLQGKQTIFDTELFQPIFKKIEELSQKKAAENIVSFRVIADHMRASTFILGDEIGTVPSNVEQGYILRRFIRRSIRHGKLLGIEQEFCSEVAATIVAMYKADYPILEKKKQKIFEELKREEQRFRMTLEKGLREFDKFAGSKKIGGKDTFLLFQSYGFPLEMTVEEAKSRGLSVDVKGFEAEYEKHKELSRAALDKKFKSGLADQSVETTRLHTATHLLNAALKTVLQDPNVKQRGSNITAERLRFDFTFGRKLTDEELRKVEAEVNDVIQKGVDVCREEMAFDEAKKQGAEAEFEGRYDEVISVYSIERVSKEVCRGSHVKNTKELGHFRIVKEEGIAAGVRRIRAVLE